MKDMTDPLVKQLNFFKDHLCQSTDNSVDWHFPLHRHSQALIPSCAVGNLGSVCEWVCQYSPEQKVNK